MALSNNQALVGAPGKDDIPLNSGAAYVFERDGTGIWAEVDKLTASDASGRDQLGISVALSGGRALVGANRDDVAVAGTNIANSPTSFTGSAYVYVRDGTGIWAEVAKLISRGAQRDTFLGGAIALSNDLVLAGVDPVVASLNPDPSSPRAQAFVFDIADLGGNEDEDEDGVIDAADNCPADANPLQENFDEDLFGDACDLDDDNDGVEDINDGFPINTDRAAVCEPGFFGAFSCESAPAGTFVAESAALSATNCAVGTFSASEASTECELAPIGSYVDTVGAIDAIACPEGTTTEAIGSTSVEACVSPIVEEVDEDVGNEDVGNEDVGNEDVGNIDATNPITLISWPTGFNATFEYEVQESDTLGGALREWQVDVVTSGSFSISNAWISGGYNAGIQLISGAELFTFTNQGQSFIQELVAGDVITFTVQGAGSGFDGGNLFLNFTALTQTLPATGECGVPVPISLPFSFDGAGEFCWEVSGAVNFINSWSTDSIQVNGESFTNRWSNSLPASADGNLIILYNGSFPWSHFEISGTN